LSSRAIGNNSLENDWNEDKVMERSYSKDTFFVSDGMKLRVTVKTAEWDSTGKTGKHR